MKAEEERRNRIVCIPSLFILSILSIPVNYFSQTESLLYLLRFATIDVLWRIIKAF